MTDDLVERLLDWPYQGETMAHEAADRIEQLEKELSTCRMAQVVMDNTVAKLTAERDGLLRCVTDNHVALCRAEAAEAERDSYRKALEDIVADCEADYPPSPGAIKYAAHAALKGETNE